MQLSGQIEDVKQGARRDQSANKDDHTSVSFRACSRYCSNSAFPARPTPPAAMTWGRVLQVRTISTTVVRPSTSTRYGITQATRLKPVVVGAIKTVGPYFWTKACSVKSSLSPRST